MWSDGKRGFKIVFILVVIFLFSFTRVNADSCEKSEKASLKKEASNIEIVPYLDDTYDPNHNYLYAVYITNFSENFYILDSDGNRFEYDSSYSTDSTYGQYAPGSKVKFTIYGAYDGNCFDTMIANITVNFDYYNDYSTHDECKGIEEFYLCKKNYSGEITSEEWFLEQVSGYKNGTVENIIDDDTDEKTIFDILKEKYLIIIGVVTIVIIFILIITIHEKKKIKIKLKERGKK